MLTIKREPKIPYDSSKISNQTKHLNQLSFKGILHNNNIFEVDQQSFNDSNNVYLDKNSTLISRPPIVHSKLPTGYVVSGSLTVPTEIFSSEFKLVDKYDTGNVELFIGINSLNMYKIVAMQKDGNLLAIRDTLVNKYYVTIIEKYIIVFNNIDAIILDSDNFETGWQLFKDFVEVPITKRIIGQETYEDPINQFTESYKEEYIWNESVLSMLPEGDSEVIVNRPPTSLRWKLTDSNINTEFRVLRSLNINITELDLISVARNTTTGIMTLAVARDQYVLLSHDNGQSFERVLYPAHKGFLRIAKLSEDGLEFFFVAVDGVYKYNIDSTKWKHYEVSTANKDKVLNGSGLNNAGRFLNAEVFAFVLHDDNNNLPLAKLYVKAPKLKISDFDVNSLSYITIDADIDPRLYLNKVGADLANNTIRIEVDGDDVRMSVWLPGDALGNTVFINVLGQGDDDTSAIIDTIHIPYSYGGIKSIEYTSTNPDTVNNFTFRGVNVEGIIVNDNKWYKFNGTIGKEDNINLDEDEQPIGWVDRIDIRRNATMIAEVTADGAPVDLITGQIIDINTYSVDGEARLPIELNGETWPTEDRRVTISNGTYYYMLIGNTLYTNIMLEDQITSIIYTYINDSPYTKIPNLTYTDKELYLAFGNTLMITSNKRDGTTLEFNLPKINNHAFTSNITNMINVSSTQIAIFLIDQIHLATYTPDEALTFRYDYFNTRLSVGVRLGDDVINTNDGVYTMFPTPQGLGVMNYQENVAATDQVVEYLSRDIIDIWQNFYNSGRVKLIQMQDYVIMTNNTKQYLILDLRTMSWWKLESPVNIAKLITDQYKLEFISNGLFVYKEDGSNYRDLNTKFINWYILSQPLHFNRPNHYKNMKQIIFQFEENEVSTQTLRAQIKLYRKQITLREPEVINFKVDGYKTFVKRFNYWKINEVQWGLAADSETENPSQLKLNGLSIKYEQGDEVK